MEQSADLYSADPYGQVKLCLPRSLEPEVPPEDLASFGKTATRCLLPDHGHATEHD